MQIIFTIFGKLACFCLGSWRIFTWEVGANLLHHERIGLFVFLNKNTQIFMILEYSRKSLQNYYFFLTFTKKIIHILNIYEFSWEGVRLPYQIIFLPNLILCSSLYLFLLYPLSFFYKKDTSQW